MISRAKGNVSILALCPQTKSNGFEKTKQHQQKPNKTQNKLRVKYHWARLAARNFCSLRKRCYSEFTKDYAGTMEKVRGLGSSGMWGALAWRTGPPQKRSYLWKSDRAEFNWCCSFIRFFYENVIYLTHAKGGFRIPLIKDKKNKDKKKNHSCSLFHTNNNSQFCFLGMTKRNL